ncbi:PhoH family protein [Methanobacterium aggregans]|uniref:PhoH family protein n=1 Tax=Methanobacterium aggregans TaxID=1615586 RepID=UPI001AE5BC72|nr:PhoH family protein [Methanobacterium aggregans]MBP2046540.1 signal recognition particle receptor subunit beta [Methanobacterium aggregans]
MNTKKVMVFGTPGSSKGDALKKICSKLVETVSMEYGTAVIENTKIHFFSPAEDEKFRFMQDVLSKNLDGALIFLDSCQNMTENQIKSMKSVMGEAPYVIFTNHENSTPTNLSTSEGVPVIYTDEDVSSRVDTGIKKLLNMMSQLNGGADYQTHCKT